MPIQNNVLTFDTFTSYPEIVHCVSTRSLGSVRLIDGEWEKFLATVSQSFTIDQKKIVLMVQTHSSNVAWVTHANVEKPADDTDALLTSEKDLFLAVRTGDCVPILLYDPVKKVCGVIHAGWRGLFKEIIPTTISELKKNGSNPQDLKVAIGPCICVNCYEFGRDIVETFESKFAAIYPGGLPFIRNRDDKVYVDQRQWTRLQLTQAGVLDANIEDSGICTKESLNQFFSYRGDTQETFGLFVSIIGMKS